MKTLITLFTLILGIGLSSCIQENVGPQGPQGPQGPRGPAGPKGDKGETGFVFEFENVSFTAPDYEVFLPFPNNFESYTSDVVLVYFLWDVVKINGQDADVWRQLPQTLLTNLGILQYNFDFTVEDVRLFIQADFDRNQLGANQTDDWIVRVVVVPGDFWNSSRLAAGEIDYHDLKATLGLPELEIPASFVNRW